MKKKLSIILTSMIFAFVLSSCNANTPTTQTVNNNDESILTSSDAEPQTNTETDPLVNESENSNFTLNEASTLGDWEITVTGMEIVNSIQSSQYTEFRPDEGNKYIRVFVTISNNGKSADTFLPSYGIGDDIYTRLYFGDGYEFSSTNLLGYDSDLHDKHLNPLSSASGEIVFTVSDSVADSSDELIFSLISASNNVNYKIR